MKYDTPRNHNPAYLAGQKAAADWINSLPEYQNFVAATNSHFGSRDIIPKSAYVPNPKLTQYLFKLLERRISAIANSTNEGYRRSLVERWKDDIGDPPNLHKFFLSFIFTIHKLVQLPVWYLVSEVGTEKALKALRKVLDPAIARYRRLLQQLRADPIFCGSPATKDFVLSFCEGAYSLLNNCAPRVSKLSKDRIKWGVDKPITSPPHKQEIFDETLVNLVDYLRPRVLTETQSELFKDVSKILSLAWGRKLCPDHPKMWQQRYQRAKGREPGQSPH
jgi:hypothetical protein